MTKPVADSPGYCMIQGAGVFGDEVCAARVSFAMQQVYDRYFVWVRLTGDEYRAFPANLETLRPLMNEERRILLSHGGWSRDIAAFDSDLLGPAPFGVADK